MTQQVPTCPNAGSPRPSLGEGPGVRATRHRPYPEYKDSGVEWLGEIPVEWEVVFLKRFFNVQLGKMLQSELSTSEDTLEPYLRAANIFWTGVDLSDVRQMWFSPQEQKQYALAKGDLLISEGGDVGRSCLWNGELEHCYIQNAINRVRARGQDLTRFLYYWMYVLKHSGHIDMLCNKATIAHFTAEKVERLEVILPLLPEQRAIATFLDRETARTDALVAKKERLIELLQEKRAALISHAVTKGLDPDAEMVDSGVEWLGEIPVGWDVIQLRRLTCKIGSGVTPRGGAAVYTTSGIPFVRSQNVHFSGLKMDDIAYISEEIHEDMNATKVFAGDVLLNITGASIGRCCVVPDDVREANVNQHVCIVRPGAKIYSGFLSAYLSSHVGQTQIFLAEKGISREGLNFEQLSLFKVTLPSLEEQSAIISYLDRTVSQIDRIIVKTEKQIQFLQEYRTALISAAVTGKIDVREEVVS